MNELSRRPLVRTTPWAAIAILTLILQACVSRSGLAAPPPLAKDLAISTLRALVLAQNESRTSGTGPGAIIRMIGVGSILTADGTIWEYLPDRDLWVSIDEAFRMQKKQTHVLPLPVAPESIAEMETFGFILTKSGEVWLYDIPKDGWKKLPSPGR